MAALRGETHVERTMPKLHGANSGHVWAGKNSAIFAKQAFNRLSLASKFPAKNLLKTLEESTTGDEAKHAVDS